MAKFYGKIGYAETKETTPGVWTEVITEKSYYGDVLKVSRRLQNTTNINDDVNVSNELSILADPFAYQNFHAMRYVTWMGASWKISNVTVQRPRLILSIGGIYNGETIEITSAP